VQRGDGVAQLGSCGRRAGPGAARSPFASDLFEPALRAVAALRADGFLYLGASPWGEAELAPLGLQPYRQLKAGAVYAHLLRRSETAA
jgi:hypothetical protein